jgi:septal ring factor EnvC (AmiA/AmiB activator)
MVRNRFFNLSCGGIMHKRRFFSAAGIGSIVICAALFLGSCTPKITDEQKKQLMELRASERSLNDDIQKKRDEKAKLESELNARKSELKKCNDEVDYIKQKLAVWPDIWPDWKPEQK